MVATIEISDNLNTKFLEISPKTIARKLFILREHLRKDSYLMKISDLKKNSKDSYSYILQNNWENKHIGILGNFAWKGNFSL